MKLRLLLICSVIVFTFGATAKPRVVGRPTLIVIGGLFSLTGDGATLRAASSAALDLAARDINQELGDLHLPYRVQTNVDNTQLAPSLAPPNLAHPVLP